MASVFEAGKEHDVAVLTAAEFAGKPVDQLEANRDKLYGIEPTPKTISGAGPSEGCDGEGAPLPGPWRPAVQRVGLHHPRVTDWLWAAGRNRRGETLSH